MERENMEIVEIKKEQSEYISRIAELESDIFPDPWSTKSIEETLDNPQARIWAVTSIPESPASSLPVSAETLPASSMPVSAGTSPDSPLSDVGLLGYVIFYYVLDEGEIARIATAPAYRRQGVAAKLLGKMRTFSREQEITRWLLDVRMSNEPAIHFYEASGFTRDGVRKNFYANPAEDAILMSCEV